MWQLSIQICVLLLSACCLPSLDAATCEETETSQVKMDLAKKSIESAKSLYPKCEGETTDGNCTVKDRSLAHLNVALVLINEANLTCTACPDPKVKPPPPQGAPMDCSDIKARGNIKSGVYQVYPIGRASNKSLDVYCDMETASGGWTVFQRRGNFTNLVDFEQDWHAYKTGFGDLQEEFWLGNDNIAALTKQGDYTLRLDLGSLTREDPYSDKREYAYVILDSFSVGEEKFDYMVSFIRPGGNATDPMHLQMEVGIINKSRFQTKDHGTECSKMFNSGFWYSEPCQPSSNLNGKYQPGEHDPMNAHWMPWKQHEGLYSVEMKIKRKNA